MENKNDEKYVWYACYGSNLSYERFMLYIKGGICKDNGKEYKGCRNPAKPLEDKECLIPYELYFGGTSTSWEKKGVCFLNLNKPGKTLGRMYLITEEQLEDVRCQEGRGEKWYNKKHLLNEDNPSEKPIFTITNKAVHERNPPSEKYLGVVRKGLKETYPAMSDTAINDYLQKRISAN